MRNQTECDFLLEHAARWRQWAKLAGTMADRVDREKLARFYERLALEKSGAIPPLLERPVRAKARTVKPAH